MWIEKLQINSLLASRYTHTRAIINLLRVHTWNPWLLVNCLGKVLVSARHHICLLGDLQPITWFWRIQSHFSLIIVLHGCIWLIQLLIFMIDYLHFIWSNCSSTHSWAVVVTGESLLTFWLHFWVHRFSFYLDHLHPWIIGK